MNLVIQMMMLIVGVVILIGCKVKFSDIFNGVVFKVGMVVIFLVFGVVWMSDIFFQVYMGDLKFVLEDVVKGYLWIYVIVLFLVLKLVNSQVVVFIVIVLMGLQLGVDFKMLIVFFFVVYGYFVLLIYLSDLVCIGFDCLGIIKIGKFIINYSFIISGFIGVICLCIIGYVLVIIFM